MNKPLIRFVAMALVLSLGIGTAYAGARGGGTRISAGTSRPVSNGAIVKPDPSPNHTPAQQAQPQHRPQPKPQPQPQPQPQQSSSRRSSIIGSLASPGGTANNSMIGSLASPGGTATNSMIGSLGASGRSSIIGNTTPAVEPGPGPNPGPKPGPGPKPRPNDGAVGVTYYDTGVTVEIGQVESAPQTAAPQVEQVMQSMPDAEQIQQMARQLQGPVTRQVEQAVQQQPQPVQEKLNDPIVILPRSVNAGNGSRATRSNSKPTYGIPGMSGGNGNGPLIYNP